VLGLKFRADVATKLQLQKREVSDSVQPCSEAPWHLATTCLLLMIYFSRPMDKLEQKEPNALESPCEMREQNIFRVHRILEIFEVVQIIKAHIHSKSPHSDSQDP
jgi:hypothetical protein